MRLFNPTPEFILAKYRGIAYTINTGCYIQVSAESGKSIIENFKDYGLVSLEFKSPDRMEIQKEISLKSLQGLEKYISTLHYVMDQYLELDTELKQNNQFGTVLKHKNVKKATRFLEQATRMVKDIESKYGISIARNELEEKTNNLMSSIEAIVHEFETNEEEQQKAMKQESELNHAVDDFMKDHLAGSPSV